MTKLNASNVIPLYEQLASQIQAQVDSGKIRYGEQILPESQLSQQYGVSRITVRKAVTQLVENGVLIKKQGKGTFVAFPEFVDGNRKDMGSFTAACLVQHLLPGTQVISQSIIYSTKQLNKRLQITETQELVYINRIRFINNYPAVYEEDYFPIEYRFLLEMDLANRSIFDIIRDRSGVIPDHFINVFQVKRANAEQMHYLEVGRDEPLLGVSQTVYDKDDKVIYFNEQSIRSDIYKYTIKSY